MLALWEVGIGPPQGEAAPGFHDWQSRRPFAGRGWHRAMIDLTVDGARENYRSKQLRSELYLVDGQ